MPFAFIDSGGSQNNFIAYTFFTLIITSYLFQGKKRNVFIFLLIGIFMCLLSVEYYFPEIIPIHNRTSQFFDRLFQVPLMLFCSSLVTKKFDNPVDFLSRLVGDEFAILSENVEKEIEDKVEAIKLQLEEKTKDFGFLVSISYGIVSLNNFEVIDDAFRCADEKLCINKKQNKKR